MTADKQKAVAADGKKEKEIERRWTKPLTDAGWTAIPNVIFERMQALGLDMIDVMIILHLSGYWWKKGKNPFPSVGTLAASIGVQPRTIQRHITTLQKAGLMERIVRKTAGGRNLSNEYSFDGLIKHATPFAQEHVAARQRKKTEAIERAKRKTVKLELVKG